MKKFRFSLEKVLEYKQEIVDVRRSEYAAALTKVRQQQEVIRNCEVHHEQLNSEYRVREKEGMSIVDARMFELSLQAVQRELAKEKKTLAALQQAAEQKRDELVASRQEARAIDKLKEKKLAQYQAETQKSEEKVLDDLVCARLCCR